MQFHFRAMRLRRVDLDDVGIARALLLDCDEHALLFVCGVVFGQNTQQWAQFQPPLVFRDSLPEGRNIENENQQCNGVGHKVRETHSKLVSAINSLTGVKQY